MAWQRFLHAYVWRLLLCTSHFNSILSAVTLIWSISFALRAQRASLGVQLPKFQLAIHSLHRQAKNSLTDFHSLTCGTKSVEESCNSRNTMKSVLHQAFIVYLHTLSNTCMLSITFEPLYIAFFVVLISRSKSTSSSSASSSISTL